ncbi:MAG: copper amine oxidase N-terminal domain-containing protein [Clostridiales bacterium]|jgi:hypothetical protein|nr:copper amine oxidase N-terminal domain-containing protein [Clostridiales bacterium]
MRKKRKRFAAGCLSLILAACLASGPVLPAAASADDGYVTDILHEVVVPAGMDYIVVDVLDGVEARYRTTAYPDVTGDFSCAGFVKMYYEAVYGVQVQNLDNAGPLMPSDMLTRVNVPQKGDIIFYPSPPNQSNHSAIVKTFDGQNIVLIEQNYKWAQSNSTYTYINRTVPYPPSGADQYEIWRLIYVPDEPGNSAQYPEQGNTEWSSGQQDAYGLLPPITPAPTPAPTPTPAQAYSYQAVVMIGRMSMNVNGQEIPIEAPALIENGRTMMPVRYVSYAMGLGPNDLVWQGDIQTGTINNGGNVIRFTIGSDIIYVNGEPKRMDCPATLKQDGFSYLPVAYIADALGVQYTWNEYNAYTKGATFYK